MSFNKIRVIVLWAAMVAALYASSAVAFADSWG
jgi:hypothetical protein